MCYDALAPGDGPAHKWSNDDMARKTAEDLAALDASIKRWKTRMKRAMTMIEKLEKRRKRIATKSAPAKPLTTGSSYMPVSPEPGNAGTVKVTLVDPDKKAYDEAWRQTLPPDTGIPEFLRRGAAAQAAVNDVIAAEEIKAEQATKAKAKAAGRIAKMKAKKAGDLKKMPLSGKAALDYIKG